MPTDEQLREQFERVRGNGYPDHANEYLFQRDEFGNYLLPDVNNQWYGWQKAHRSRDAEVQALREALTEVTEDLASELLAKYAPMQAHPDTLRRFARDMELVYRARKLLAGGETGEAE